MKLKAKAFLPIGLVFGLAACGGGGTGAGIPASLTPSGAAGASSSGGYATGTTNFLSGNTYTTPVSYVMKLTASGGQLTSVGLEGQSMTVSFNNTFTTATIGYGGQTFVASCGTTCSSANPLYTATVNGVDLELQLLVGASDVEIYSVTADSTTEFNGGYFIAGANTDPAVVDAKTGSAVFNGSILAGVLEIDPSSPSTSNGYSVGGTVTFNVDYDANQIDGTMVINSASGGGFAPGTIATVTVPTTTIVGNTFGTTGATISSGQFASGTTFTSTAVTGGFYGATGGDLVGNVAAEGANGSTQILINGVYAAN